jgi:hypothetical protein
MQALENEIETYNAKLPELLSHVGKFVLIREETVEGFFDTYTDALRAGYERHLDVRFLVKKVAPAEQVSYFTRDLVVECRA